MQKLLIKGGSLTLKNQQNQTPIECARSFQAPAKRKENLDRIVKIMEAAESVRKDLDGMT